MRRRRRPHPPLVPTHARTPGAYPRAGERLRAWDPPSTTRSADAGFGAAGPICGGIRRGWRLVVGPMRWGESGLRFHYENQIRPEPS